MNEIDKKIIKYLIFKDKIANDAISRELSISKEAIDAHLSELSFLLINDYARVEQPSGAGKYAYITEKGRRALWTRKKFLINFLSENWLNIVGTLAAIIAALTGAISIIKK